MYPKMYPRNRLTYIFFYYFFHLKDITICISRKRTRMCLCVFQAKSLLAMKFSKTSVSEAGSSCSILILIIEVICGCFFNGFLAVKCPKNFVLLLVSCCLFEFEGADLKIIRWKSLIDNIAVFVMVSKSIDEPVLSNKLESSRRKAGQSKEKIKDFHFSFRFCWISLF